ncbi:MAG: hypothetical protein ACXWZY_11010, partial [Gaiellaceae bacterium]
AVLLLPFLARRQGVSLRLLFAGWVQPLAAGVLAALPTLALLAAVITTDSLLALAVVGAAWTIAFGAIAWRVGLTDAERALVRSLVWTRRRPSFEPELPEAPE